MPGSLDATIDLVSLADVKEYLKITGSTEDSMLSFLINEISKLTNNYTGRQLLKKTHTEYYNGNGHSLLILNQYPIISISKLYDDTLRVFGASSEIASSALLIMKDSGEIQLWDSPLIFTQGIANIKIVYDAGYDSTTVPADLQLAVKRWIAVQYYKFTNKRHEIRSETVRDVTTTFFDQNVPTDVAEILLRYRRFGGVPDFSHSE